MSYAAIKLLDAVRRHLTVIIRLRLDARLFEPPPVRQPGQRGRPRASGARLTSLPKIETQQDLHRIAMAYGGTIRLQTTSGRPIEEVLELPV
jgi:hypothetical protein